MLRRGMMAQPAGGGGDPYWANVVSLLHFDGTDGSTTFTDQTGKVWTANGSAQIDTAQSMFGGASGLFGASGDYITTPNTADHQFGSGDFTIEFFIYRPSNYDSDRLVFIKRASAAARGMACFFPTGSYTLNMRLGDTNETAWNVFLGSAPIAPSQFTHIAIQRRGSQYELFQDGVKQSTADASGFVLADDASPFVFGAAEGGGYGLSSSIDELRITKGVARYTANFTPPAAPFPDS